MGSRRSAHSGNPLRELSRAHASPPAAPRRAAPRCLAEGRVPVAECLTGCLCARAHFLRGEGQTCCAQAAPPGATHSTAQHSTAARARVRPTLPMSRVARPARPWRAERRPSRMERRRYIYQERVLLYALMVACAFAHSVNPIDAWCAARLASSTAAASSAAVAATAASTAVVVEALRAGAISASAELAPLQSSAEFALLELLYYAASAGGLYSWWHFLRVEVDELQYESGFDLRRHYSSFWCARGVCGVRNDPSRAASRRARLGAGGSAVAARHAAGYARASSRRARRAARAPHAVPRAPCGCAGTLSTR